MVLDTWIDSSMEQMFRVTQNWFGFAMPFSSFFLEKPMFVVLVLYCSISTNTSIIYNIIHASGIKRGGFC